jgi:hypothetical protein
MKTFNSSNIYRNLLAGATLTAACLLLAASASAQYTVTTLADNLPNQPTVDGSLRQAIDSAIGGIYEINFDPSLFQNGPVTITLTGGELLINNPNSIVMIYGPDEYGPGNLLTISGNNSSRVFEISAGSTVWAVGFTITGGLANGSIGGENNSDTFGGPGSGGGMLNNGTVTLNFCTIASNSAIGGQFINLNNGGNGGEAFGGGLANFGNAVLNFCTISDNTATGGSTMGGGQNILLQPNISYGGDGWGGGIYNAGDLVLGGCTVSGNQANGGDEDVQGGIFNSGGWGAGGGIFSFTYNLQMTNCTIANNTAAGGNADSWTELFSNSGLPGNGVGGGIGYEFSVVALDSCTISQNTAIGGTLGSQSLISPPNFTSAAAGDAYGGGLSSSVDPPPSLGGGDSLFGAHFAPTIANTIVAGNFVIAGAAPSDDPLGAGDSAGSTIGPDVNAPLLTVNSQGHNLIGVVDASSGWIGSDLPAPTSAPGLDPVLGPLQDNGGPTFTMALGASSPAANNGSDTIGVDQRCSPRPIAPTPCDIGACELQDDRFAYASIRHSHSSLVNLSWTYLPMGTLATVIRPLFGLQTIPAGSLGSGEWTPFTGAVRYYNANNQFVATDPIGTGPGMLYKLVSPPTNMLFIRPAVTIPAALITSNNATLCGTTTPYGSNTLYWFEYGTNTGYGMNTPTNSLTTVTNPANLANLIQPIAGLNPATLYHYQLVVTDDDGTQLGGDRQFATPAAETTYIGNSLSVSNGAPDGGAPLVILGEYSPAGPLAAASPATTLLAGTVQDVKFYGQNYNFTLYALSYFSAGRSTNEQTFQVIASQSFSGTNSAPDIQTLAVTNFPVYAGNLLAFAGQGPYYPQTANDATNSDATYEDSTNPNSSTATLPVGPGSMFTVGVNSDTAASYEYISDVFGNQGRTYGFGVDILAVP